jgi:hypothetical protein
MKPGMICPGKMGGNLKFLCIYACGIVFIILCLQNLTNTN